MCSQTRNSCAKAFDNRSRSKNLMPKKSRGGQFDSPPPPRPLGLNYYTRVNTGTKIQKNNMSISFSITEATHWLPIVKCADYNGPKCVCAIPILLCNKQTLDFVFISLSCTPPQHFMPNELLLFTYHFPQTSQQNQKTTSTKSRQGTFLKYRLGSNSRSPFGQKKRNFPNFLLAQS